MRTSQHFELSGFSTVYGNYRKGAEKRNLEFPLTKEEFYVISQCDCWYCGKPPAQMYSQTRQARFHYKTPYIYNGLDRLDNKKGYIPGNVVPCCWLCNQMKSTLSVEDFIGQARLIARKLSNLE